MLTKENILEINGVSEDTAEMIVKLLNGSVEPEEVSKKCARFVSAAFFEPRKMEKIMVAVDELLGMCGEEVIEDGNEYSDFGVHMCPRFSYCNTGDSYATTFVRDHKNREYRIMSYEDMVADVGEEPEF